MLDEKLIKGMMEGVNDAYAAIMPLNAIWLEKAIRTSIGKQIRIKSGDLIRIENGKLIDCDDLHLPNAKIISLYGNLANTFFKIKALSLSTNEVNIIEL